MVFAFLCFFGVILLFYSWHDPLKLILGDYIGIAVNKGRPTKVAKIVAMEIPNLYILETLTFTGKLCDYVLQSKRFSISKWLFVRAQLYFHRQGV